MQRHQALRLIPKITQNTTRVSGGRLLELCEVYFRVSRHSLDVCWAELIQFRPQMTSFTLVCAGKLSDDLG